MDHAPDLPRGTCKTAAMLDPISVEEACVVRNRIVQINVVQRDVRRQNRHLVAAQTLKERDNLVHDFAEAFCLLIRVGDVFDGRLVDRDELLGQRILKRNPVVLVFRTDALPSDEKRDTHTP